MLQTSQQEILTTPRCKISNATFQKFVHSDPDQLRSVLSKKNWGEMLSAVAWRPVGDGLQVELGALAKKEDYAAYK